MPFIFYPTRRRLEASHTQLVPVPPRRRANGTYLHKQKPEQGNQFTFRQQPYDTVFQPICMHNWSYSAPRRQAIETGERLRPTTRASIPSASIPLPAPLETKVETKRPKTETPEAVLSPSAKRLRPTTPAYTIDYEALVYSHEYWTEEEGSPI